MAQHSRSKKRKPSKKEAKAEVRQSVERAAFLANQPVQVAAVVVKKRVELPPVVSVRDYADKLDQPPTAVIGALMRYGVLATINQAIDFETAAIVADDLGAEVMPTAAKAAEHTAELVNEADLRPRPPVVAVMGHVDHGKTTLLDAVRQTNVVAGESGGITQHIGAYQVDWQSPNGDQRKITFLDTPGHAAFATMRAHGATITDIIILVVAADDGVKPQTKEVIDHAKAANVPLVVAITKMDKPEANPDMVKAGLAEAGVLVEGWGGETPIVPISSISREGIETLLDTVMVVADMKNLRADPAATAVGVVIEANKQSGRGAVATILIQNGTMHPGESISIGSFWGRVRFLENERGERLEAASPGTPVIVAGLSGVPKAGQSVAVFSSEKEAREAAASFAKQQDVVKSVAQLKTKGMSALAERVGLGRLRELSIVLKADVQGSIDAIAQLLEDIGTSEVAIKTVRSGVGDITESDILLAQTTGSLLIGFRVALPAPVRRLAEQSQVPVSLYDVIYELQDDLRRALSGLLPTETVEVVVGRAKVLRVFRADKREKILGVRVEEGKLVKGQPVHVFRGKEIVGEGTVESLRREKTEVPEISAGVEAGVGLPGHVEVAEGDVLELFRTEELKREL